MSNASSQSSIPEEGIIKYEEVLAKLKKKDVTHKVRQYGTIYRRSLWKLPGPNGYHEEYIFYDPDDVRVMYMDFDGNSKMTEVREDQLEHISDDVVKVSATCRLHRFEGNSDVTKFFTEIYITDVIR
jgi:hypothetical protein